MYVYLITLLGGYKTEYRANSPKEAWIAASKYFDVEVIHIKYLRGK